MSASSRRGEKNSPPRLTDKALEELEKLGSRVVREFEPVEVYPTGSLELDMAFGCAGVPIGAYTQLAGADGTGKTLLCELMMLRNKRDGRLGAFLDIERRWNVKYAYQSGMGVPGEDYILLYPDCEEAALESIRKLVKEGVHLIVLDSIAALTPRSAVEGAVDDANVGLRARLLATFFGQVADEVKSSQSAIVLTNQVRDKIGGNTGSFQMGPQIIIPGGRALKHRSDIAATMQPPMFIANKILDQKTKSDETFTKISRPIGMKIKGKLWKNNFGPNFTEFGVRAFYYPGLHIDRARELVEYGQQFGILTKKDGTLIAASTAAYHYAGDELGKGKYAAVEYLRDNTDVAEAIEIDIREAIRNQQSIAGMTTGDADGNQAVDEQSLEEG